MNASKIRTVADAIHRGSLSFSQVVGVLTTAGVEYYFVDYSQMRTTYYGGSIAVTCDIPYAGMPPISATFDEVEVKAAILDSRQNGQSHRDFSRRVTSAGVQGYFAFLKGERVVYLGRLGDSYAEWFPGAGP